MTDAQIRERLARISARPAPEWQRRVAQEFPGDPALRMQAMLWLHAEKNAADAERVPPSLGDLADDRYELTLCIDAGTSSSVWKAFDRRLGRHVALKVFAADDESEAMEQVLAEARAASDVVSEHVVRVLDVHFGDGRPYIVMELVSEYDAEKGDIVLGASASAAPPRDIDEVAEWVMHVARGVHAAHLRNVFHRDLKPRNVLVTPLSRRARVADFGLAVSGASPDVSHPSITLLRRGPSGPVSVRGTPEYMAPEQARGLPLALDAHAAHDREVLVAIDVWGLGAIAYELLSGHPPWLAREEDDLSAWEIAASAERPPPLTRTRDGGRIPVRLRRVVEKMLAADPRARYPSAGAVAHELQAFLARRPTTLDTSRPLRIALWSRRNPQLALSVLVALMLAGFVLVTHFTVTRLRGQRDALDRQVATQKKNRAELDAVIRATRGELDRTRITLAGERANLGALEKSLEEERRSYEALIEAKERLLESATSTSRNIMRQLEEARREQKMGDEARATLARQLEDVRLKAEKSAKDRDQFRKERETARTERDRAQKERDAALVEREALEEQLEEREAALRRATAPRDAAAHARQGS